MKVVLCLTRYECEWSGIKQVLDRIPTASVLRHSPGELLQAAGSLEPDLLLVDSRSPSDDFQMLVGLAPSTTTMIMVIAGLDLEFVGATADVDQHPDIYDSFSLDDTPVHQRKVILRSLERSSLLWKDTTQGSPAGLTTEWPASNPPANSGGGRSSLEMPWERALRSLSRTLSAGFDVNGLIEPFLDLVVELSGAARVSILTLDPVRNSFTAAGSRGLHGPMLHAYGHPVKSKLVDWLVKEGRPLRKSDTAMQPASVSMEVQRAFDALQATVCIPMAARGELVAVLALGPRLTGQPPTDDQVELLFTTGSHVAMALQNIRLHQETAWQEAKHESVLEHMTNGIAAIDEHGKVSVLNRRAAEILRLSRDSVLRHDLRALPAPLGDFLFNTMQTGEVTRRTNVALPGSGIPLEISTYPLFVPETGHSRGSVLVLEDITERLALDQSRRHADRQEIFTRLVSQLAHEIKNPLSAVKTFADLFPEHVRDPDFSSFVQNTVIPEILRLDTVVGKLVDFVDQNALQVQTCDLRPMVRDAIQRLMPEAAAAGIKLELVVNEPIPLVRADPIQLPKALVYIFRHLLLHVQRDEGVQVEVTIGPLNDASSRIALDFGANRPWLCADEIDLVFDPLFVRKDQLNLSLPAARKIILEHGGAMDTTLSAAGDIRLRIILRAAEAWNEPAGDASLGTQMMASIGG